jgi:type I restriction enzyme S subunit
MGVSQELERTKEIQAYRYKPSGIEWLGDIPEHWEVKSGLSAFTNKKIKNTGLKEETVLSLSYGKIVIKPKEKLHGLVPESFETYQLVDIGNIIIRVMDLQNDKVSLRVGLAKDKGIITSAYLCLQVTEQIIYQYGFYLLHAYDLMKIFYGMGSGLRQNLDYRDIKRMPVLIPPIPEQKQIAQYLDYKTKQINRFIKNKQKLIKLLKEQRQNIINQAVIKGTNKNVSFKPSGIEWLGDIPVHWEMRKVKNVCSLVGSGTTPTSGQMKFYNGSVPWVTTSELRENTILNTKSKITEEALNIFSALKLFPPQSLLIAMYGATIGRIGILGIEASTNQACCALVLSKSIKVEFAFYWFLSQKPHLVNLSYGGGQPNISQEKIKSFPIPLPPIEEQKAIVEYIEKETAIIDKAIERTEREIELIKEYKTTLISEVVTGKKPSEKLTEEQLKWLEESEENNEPENDELEENAEAIEEEIE